MSAVDAACPTQRQNSAAPPTTPWMIMKGSAKIFLAVLSVISFAVHLESYGPLGQRLCAVKKPGCAEVLRPLGAVSCVMVLSRTNLVMKWGAALTAPFVCRGLLGPAGSATAP